MSSEKGLNRRASLSPRASPRGEREVDVKTLARKVYELLKQELKLERERGMK